MSHPRKDCEFYKALMQLLIGCEIVDAGQDPETGMCFIQVKGDESTKGHPETVWIQSDEEGNDNGVLYSENLWAEAQRIMGRGDKGPTDEEKAALVRNFMDNTTGSDEQYQHICGLRYTQGMKFVADTCGAYWLLDIVASVQAEIQRKFPDDSSFQVWELNYAREGEQGDGNLHWEVACWSDTPHKSTRLYYQSIGFSDFPPQLAAFQFWVEHRCALLKQEH